MDFSIFVMLVDFACHPVILSIHQLSSFFVVALLIKGEFKAK